MNDYVSSVFTICGVYKKDTNVAFLKTCTGEFVTIDRVGKVATIKMDGVVLPIVETIPESSRRRMDELAAGEALPEFRARALRGRGRSGRPSASYGWSPAQMASNRAGND